MIRYYDVFRRGYLSEDVIRLMIQDMHTGEALSEDAIEAKLAEVLRNIETEDDPDYPGKVRIHQRRFLAAVGSHKFRGTSKLCRIGKPICAAISNAIFAQRQRNRKMSHQLVDVVERQHAGSCIGCCGKRPELEEVLVKLNSDGVVVDRVKPAALQKCKSQESQNSREKKTEKSSKTSLRTNSSVSSVEDPTQGVSAPSEEALKVAHNLVLLIREFAQNKGDTRNPLGLLSSTKEDQESFVKQMEVIEKALGPMLKKRRCMSVSSPAYIIGDIHGNLDDLLTMERSLWKRFPVSGPNLVFLGDMVDRGKWGVECATYLLCLSVIAPQKVCSIMRCDTNRC